MGEGSIFPPPSEERRAAEKEGDSTVKPELRHALVTQTFHATIHQLALQNIVPSFSFKASHNNVYMHMLTHFKKWCLININ